MAEITLSVSQIFFVYLVGVWQRNFEPAVCVYGTTGWELVPRRSVFNTRRKISPNIRNRFTIDYYRHVLSGDIYNPPLWSSGQSFWLQIQRFRVRFPALPDFSE